MSDSIDTLSLHGAFIGLACFFGYLIQRGIMGCEDLYHWEFGGSSDISIGKSFPLFPLCTALFILLAETCSMFKIAIIEELVVLICFFTGMVGGIVVDKLIRGIGMSMLIDHNCMQRISGTQSLPRASAKLNRSTNTPSPEKYAISEVNDILSQVSHSTI